MVKDLVECGEVFRQKAVATQDQSEKVAAIRLAFETLLSSDEIQQTTLPESDFLKLIFLSDRCRTALRRSWGTLIDYY